MTPFQTKLVELGACEDACKWVGRKSLTTAWKTCGRADWMLWLAGKAKVDRKLLVRAACVCARDAWRWFDENDGDAMLAAMLAVHAAEEWCEGRADLDDVRAAARAADAAYAHAAYAAAHAAHAAAADDAAYAAYAAACAAARAADYAYGVVRGEKARAAAHRRMCKQLRQIIPLAAVEGGLR